jgi:small subunit ribosomal protein S16
MGKRNQPHYRVCAFDSRTRRNGRPIEELGNYNPFARDASKKFNLERARIEYWLREGAQPTLPVSKMLKQFGISPSRVRAAKK